jgi:hypothetical protein
MKTMIMKLEIGKTENYMEEMEYNSFMIYLMKLMKLLN